MRSLDDKLRVFAGCGVIWAALLAGSGQRLVLAQSQQPAPFPPVTRPTNGHLPVGTDDESAPDPAMRHAQDEALKKRNDDRQKQLVADTAKLLQLAQDLKSEVDKSNKDTLSIAVVKKAEEIEKLAKSVKDKMKAQ